jgi:hypothetical protein
MRSLLLALTAAGCATSADRQNPDDWFDPGSPYDVTEHVEFTDVPYDFTGETPIGELPSPEPFETWFAPSDASNAPCADWVASDSLPAEITGIVTIHPRYYIKTSGCQPTQDADSDQKYYGSYFLQDASGGHLLLGDSKVAHFDMGDRVTVSVRAIKESFDQKMISVHDVIEVERGPEPIYYETVETGYLGPEHLARVVRIEGEIATEASTFGEVYLDGDDGSRYKMNIDQELARRGVYFPLGTRLQVTGPVLYSFSEYTIIVMRIGQISEL